MERIPEDIKKDLELITSVCDELKMSLYVVGGYPRDIISGFGINNDTDLDVTEKNGNAFELSFFVAAKYGLKEPVMYEGSGTSLLTLPSGRKIEFHNAYYNVPHIIDELYVRGIEPTSINKDVYARDFTINTLLLDPKTEKIFDLTKKAVHDIKNKILRTPLSPIKSLAINPKNILRGIRFKVQFGLESTPEYEEAVKQHLPTLISLLEKDPNSEMVLRTVKKTFSYNPEKAYEEYRKLGILQFIPKQSEMDAVVKERMFGTKITPTAQHKQTYDIFGKMPDPSESGGPSPMIQRLMNERENHKSYLRRKKRERQQYLEKKLEILDKARSGYYKENPETKYLKNKQRNIRRGPGYEFIKHPR
jgi:tRNA nucleotidyltransferase (CCA-adding enzyme)